MPHCSLSRLVNHSQGTDVLYICEASQQQQVIILMHLTPTAIEQVQLPQWLKQAFQHHKPSCWDAGAAQCTNVTHTLSREVQISSQQPGKTCIQLTSYISKLATYTTYVVTHVTTLINLLHVGTNMTNSKARLCIASLGISTLGVSTAGCPANRLSFGEPALLTRLWGQYS